MKKHWLTLLTENISSVIALIFVMNAFCIFYLVLLHQVKTSDSTTITIIQLVSGILMLIIGYYYGSNNKKNAEPSLPTEAETKQWTEAINKCIKVEDLELMRNKIPATLIPVLEARKEELKKLN